jgi:hypothetical protein
MSTLVEWADKIDNRLGPISGRDADALAALLRRTAKDREDQDLALRDAISETARCADELAFWRYQAIYGLAFMLDRNMLTSELREDSAVWREAERQLEGERARRGKP